MELSVVKAGAVSAGTVSVSDATFAREYNEDLVHQVVTAFLAAPAGYRAQKNRAGSRLVARSPGVKRAPVVLARDYSFSYLALWWYDICGKPQDHQPESESQDVSRCAASILSELARQDRLMVLKSWT